MLGEVNDVTLMSIGGRVSMVSMWIVGWRAGVVMKREKAAPVVSMPNAGFADWHRFLESKG